MNVIYDSKHDAQRERERIDAEDKTFDTHVQYGKDVNNDGGINFRDIPASESARERIFAPVDDERADIRKLKSLKAQDVLEERRRQREEIAADSILKEAEHERMLSERSPARKMFDNTVSSLGDRLKNIHLPAPAPQTTSRRVRPARRMATPRPVNVINQNAPVPLGNNNVDAFTASMMPRRRIVAPSESKVRVRGSPNTTNYQAAQGLSGSMFLGNVIGGAHKPKRDNPVLNDKSPKNLLGDFNAHILGGIGGGVRTKAGKATGMKPISLMGNVGISTSAKPKKNAVQNFTSNILLGGKSKKKKGKGIFGGL